MENFDVYVLNWLFGLTYLLIYGLVCLYFMFFKGIYVFSFKFFLPLALYIGVMVYKMRTYPDDD